MPDNPRWKRRPAGSTWGDWGPDDQLGRLNLLTADKVLKGGRRGEGGPDLLPVACRSTIPAALWSTRAATRRGSSPTSARACPTSPIRCTARTRAWST